MLNRVLDKLNSIKAILINWYLCKFTDVQIFNIVESMDWVIGAETNAIQKHLKKYKSETVSLARGLTSSILHFRSINSFCSEDGIRAVSRNNTILVTWFHVLKDDKRLRYIDEMDAMVTLWHTSCTETVNILVHNGVDPKKIVLISLGIDLDHFCPLASADRVQLRKKLEIPEDCFTIGSFQKDGNGWGEGLVPKLIKGPDIFCDVVEEISKKHDIFVVLTGPARGYVKNRLEKANIPYLHKYFDDPNEVSDYFKVLDSYLLSSRIEGGPKSVLESMASGVPFVGTKVGLVSDLMTHDYNAYLTEVEDVVDLTNGVMKLIENQDYKNDLIENGLQSIKKYEFSLITREYQQKLYDPIFL